MDAFAGAAARDRNTKLTKIRINQLPQTPHSTFPRRLCQRDAHNKVCIDTSKGSQITGNGSAFSWFAYIFTGKDDGHPIAHSGNLCRCSCVARNCFCARQRRHRRHNNRSRGAIRSCRAGDTRRRVDSATRGSDEHHERKSQCHARSKKFDAAGKCDPTRRARLS